MFKLNCRIQMDTVYLETWNISQNSSAGLGHDGTIWYPKWCIQRCHSPLDAKWNLRCRRAASLCGTQELGRSHPPGAISHDGTGKYHMVPLRKWIRYNQIKNDNNIQNMSMNGTIMGENVWKCQWISHTSDMDQNCRWKLCCTTISDPHLGIQSFQCLLCCSRSPVVTALPSIFCRYVQVQKCPLRMLTSNPLDQRFFHIQAEFPKIQQTSRVTHFGAKRMIWTLRCQPVHPYAKIRLQIGCKTCCRVHWRLLNFFLFNAWRRRLGKLNCNSHSHSSTSLRSSFPKDCSAKQKPPFATHATVAIPRRNLGTFPPASWPRAPKAAPDAKGHRCGNISTFWS